MAAVAIMGLNILVFFLDPEEVALIVKTPPRQAGGVIVQGPICLIL